MKYLLIALIFFKASILNAQIVSKKGKLMPLAIGNYWVYASTLDSARVDTIKVIDKILIGSDSVFVLSNMRKLFKYKDEFYSFHFSNGPYIYESNDSIYSFLQYNGMVKWIEYFPVDTMTKFMAVYENDLFFDRIATHIGKYDVNGKSYSNCYKYTEYDENAETIICEGVGIVEGKYQGEKVYLVSYYLGNK